MTQSGVPARPPRIGIDLGGTKIEGVVLARDGAELSRKRIAAPRHDYRATIAAIAGLAGDLESGAGVTCCTIGIGMPGSLEPVSRLGKGCSSTWLLGKPVEADLRRVLDREIRVENDADCFAASEAPSTASAER